MDIEHNNTLRVLKRVENLNGTQKAHTSHLNCVSISACLFTLQSFITCLQLIIVLECRFFDLIGIRVNNGHFFIQNKKNLIENIKNRRLSQLSPTFYKFIITIFLKCAFVILNIIYPHTHIKTQENAWIIECIKFTQPMIDLQTKVP